MARRVYTPEQREAALAVLAANGGNYQKTEAETGIRRATLRQWAKSEPGESSTIATLKKEFAQTYREKLKKAREAALDRMLELLPDEKDLHKVTGAAKVLSEMQITQEVADEYGRPEAGVLTASGAASDKGSSRSPPN